MTTLTTLEKLLAAATPRPWMGPRITDMWPPGWIGVYSTADGEPWDVIGVTGHHGDDSGEQSRSDADLIVAAVNALPRLIAIAKAAEAYREASERESTTGGTDAHVAWTELTAALSALDKEGR